MIVTDYAMRQASERLTKFVILKADRLSRELGFSYIEADDAPSTFGALCAAYYLSAVERKPLPVWSGGSEGTIYANKEGNWAFRFWHDVTHVVNALGFTLGDEVRVAELQAVSIADEFGADSLEYKMFMADTAGQSVYAAMHGGEFPADQWAYVRTLVMANNTEAPQHLRMVS